MAHEKKGCKHHKTTQTKNENIFAKNHCIGKELNICFTYLLDLWSKTCLAIVTYLICMNIFEILRVLLWFLFKCTDMLHRRIHCTLTSIRSSGKLVSQLSKTCVFSFILQKVIQNLIILTLICFCKIEGKRSSVLYWKYWKGHLLGENRLEYIDIFSDEVI